MIIKLLPSSYKKMPREPIELSTRVDVNCSINLESLLLNSVPCKSTNTEVKMKFSKFTNPP